jgi:hypothetical protein
MYIALYNCPKTKKYKVVPVRENGVIAPPFLTSILAGDK